jgi:hypothetical protein
MKKSLLISLLAILLLAINVFAFKVNGVTDPGKVNGAADSKVNGVSAGAGDSGGDIINEDYGVGYGWTEDTSGGTVDENNSSTASGTGFSSPWLYIHQTSGYNGETSAEINSGSSDTEVYISFYHYPANDMGASGDRFFAVYNATGTLQFELYANITGGNCEYTLKSGDGWSVDDTSTGTYADDTAHKIRIYVKSDGDWSWTINSTAEGSGSDEMGSQTNYRVYWFGTTSWSSEGKVYIDTFDVDSTTYIN